MSDPKLGIGNAPTRCTTLPTDSEARKAYPVASGLLEYFPDACIAIANLSYVANEQHNPGKPMHWDRAKSTNEADTLMRHFLQRGSLDTDGKRHSAKLAWRALALLQKEIEVEHNEQQVQLIADCISFGMTYREIEKKHHLSYSRIGRLVKKAVEAGLLSVPVLVKDGPYCSACAKLAEVRSELTGTYYCQSCAGDYSHNLFTVLDGGKQ